MKLGPGNNHEPLTIDFSECLDRLYMLAVHDLAQYLAQSVAANDA